MSAETQIPISRPCFGKEELEAVQKPLRSGWVAQGPMVAEFETAFAARHNCTSAVATTNCTTALHIILEALGVSEGDEVIVPSFTWVASANSVSFCGAKPIFVDICTDTFNLDPEKLKASISQKTKAIMAVHLFGLPADVDRIVEIAPGIPIVEDAACAAGSLLRSKSIGTLGIAAAFSFHARKVLTTGEGGMVSTDNAALAEQLKRMRNHGAKVSSENRHGSAQPYLLPEFDELGFNYRMTDIQAAIGIEQLKKLDSFIAERSALACRYSEQLSSIDWLKLPTVPDDYVHSWQSYVTLVDKNKAPCSRNEIMERLNQNNIQTRPGTTAVHRLGLYSEEQDSDLDPCPASSYAEDQSIALPLFNGMTNQQLKSVVESLKSI